MARKLVTFAGANFTSPGGNISTISVPGVEAGDQIISVVHISGNSPFNSPVNQGIGAPANSHFCPFVITDGEIEQLTSFDCSVYTFTALIERTQMLHN